MIEPYLFQRALDRLDTIMQTGTPRQQIQAAKIVIETTLKMERQVKILDKKREKAQKSAVSEVKCIVFSSENTQNGGLSTPSGCFVPLACRARRAC